MMTTSDELRAWRSARRWTQQQAADELDYSLRAYAEYEKPDKAVPKWLSLAVSALPSDRPVKSVHNLTIGDLSDIEHVKDAEAEFRRCVTDADHARWSRKWGESWLILGQADARELARDEMREEIDDAENDASAACREADAAKEEVADLEESYDALHAAAEAVIDALGQAVVPEYMAASVAALEAAL